VGNLLAGARLVWTGPATAEQTRREVERQAEKVRQDGGIPHVISFGGSNSYAAQAYADCSAELLAQLPHARVYNPLSLMVEVRAVGS
jgi:1-aminocyclopropane-1-carboxylate deaminase/D-cysteine desulfhydrase-like pyridoxal-dependent ACC family enzyme